MNQTIMQNESVEEFKILLDDEIEMISKMKIQIEQLHDAVAKRDSVCMERILGKLKDIHSIQTGLDERLAGIRNMLSDRQLDCSEEGEECKKISIIESIPDGAKVSVRERVDKIVRLVEDIRRHFMKTSILVGECLRINRLLIEGIIPDSARVTTYCAEGSNAWRSGKGTINNTI